MLFQAALGFLNHLLRGEDWARQRLAPFSGRCIALDAGPFSAQARITPEGCFSALAADPADPPAPDVTLSLPPDFPFRALVDRAGLLAEIRISGTADLTEALGFVFRNLSWDIEGDLAQVLGDIPARRVLQGGRAFVKGKQQAAQNLAANLSEYFTEEAPLIARAADLADFSRETKAIDERTRQLEARMLRLAGG